jgi:hypothetical protein
MKKIITLLVACSLFVSFQNCKDEAPPDTTPAGTELNSLFDAAYLASQGNEDLAMTQPIADGKPARVIKDLIGTKHLLYDGPEVPSPMWLTPPVFHNDEMGGYIFLHNISPTKWASKDFEAIPQPYDVYVVLRDVEAVNYEGYFAVGIGFRNRGDKLEIKIDDKSGVTTSVDFAAPTILEFNKISIVRLRFDGANSRAWINNVPVPPGTVNVGNGAIPRLGYGSNSHTAQHDFFGMWVKFGTLSDADHEFVYEELSKKYDPGKFPNKPFANKIKAVWNGTGWTAQYEYVSPNGIAEDTGKTEFQWYYHSLADDLNLTTSFVGANAKKKTLVRSDYASIFPSREKARVFVSVKVYDVQGNSWNHFVRSSFTLDNVD